MLIMMPGSDIADLHGPLRCQDVLGMDGRFADAFLAPH
jgi:hypothetical protein